jgi:hypothetical protein
MDRKTETVQHMTNGIEKSKINMLASLKPSPTESGIKTMKYNIISAIRNRSNNPVKSIS